MEQAQPLPGTLSWRLSSHPITLLWFLGFRIGERIWDLECVFTSQGMIANFHDSKPARIPLGRYIHGQLVRRSLTFL
jgi:hypothetical protein